VQGDCQTNKFRELYNLAIQWVVIHQKNIDLADELFNRNYKRIVIYGMSDIGNRLFFELSQNSKIQILYTIDQGEPKQYYDFNCVKLEELYKYDEPDVVIVTVPHMFDEIKNNLSKYFQCDVISMTDFLYELDL
jgi:hypothetical protein